MWICRDFDGASRTRTGGLLGAIQALASTEFGLFAGISLWWRLGVTPAFSASFRSFRLRSGQRNPVLARSPVTDLGDAPPKRSTSSCRRARERAGGSGGGGP